MWLQDFTGEVQSFRDLNALTFTAGEIVIAVGTFTVDDIRSLRAPVTKVRYNHGMPYPMSARTVAAWSGSILTITVSSTLVPWLEATMGHPILAVVPNGIDAADYYVEPGIVRNGIGAIFSRHPSKAPGELLDLLRRAREMWPSIPQYVFSGDRRPAALRHCQFLRYPSKHETRRLYCHSRVWIIPSRSEGFGLPALEAMACGCAVVSSKTAGSMELIEHEHNGIILPCGNTADFLREIERLLRDTAFREQIVAAGRETAKRFTWERAGDKMEAVLNALANRM
jgi:glycosyltransferase involved in cell wall biosynthesis